MGIVSGQRTPLLAQVLCILAHPQLSLHAGLGLVEDVLGQSKVPKGHLNTIGMRPSCSPPSSQVLRFSAAQVYPVNLQVIDAAEVQLAISGYILCAECGSAQPSPATHTAHMRAPSTRPVAQLGH